MVETTTINETEYRIINEFVAGGDGNLLLEEESDHQQIDDLAIEIESSIAEWRRRIDDMATFKPRSTRSRKLKR